MSVIAILTHHRKIEDSTIVFEVIDWLEKRGHQVIAPPADRVLDFRPELRAEVRKLVEETDFLIAFGGDGTILRAAEYVYEREIPVLGVNLGKLGFLTRVEPQEVFEALEAALSGNVERDRRMLLECVLESKGIAHAPRRTTSHENWVIFKGGVVKSFALNECVISKTAGERMISLSIFVDGEYFLSYAADGVIFSTPTGSTAYSLSAGGPVLSPKTEAIVLTPVCPHTLFMRSIVFSSQEVLKVVVNQEDQPISVKMDGKRVWKLEDEGEITIRKSDRYFTLLSFGKKSFYTIFKEKLLVTKADESLGRRVKSGRC
ncbi:NAD(+)/NADH kinase [Candidatus Hakubella thermalkaliphila]|uniref:NAD kinase n=2 Tax=Candidatus Hakubella thermalkaliphila TaxID=2754717 RepID=A0A6V8Q1J0_9ACTN|nr:NAD(+)/NADH kinase [Candidatus Hakubella thermalkaliphila]GFP38635.1 NAD+ kinase [Candidatus Hakubella thermalkaliphila]